MSQIQSGDNSTLIQALMVGKPWIWALMGGKSMSNLCCTPQAYLAYKRSKRRGEIIKDQVTITHS
jgi:hypothetical protein